jgi:predicted fused transcriptional regulator/phosphomethylpyrimidine kinase
LAAKIVVKDLAAMYKVAEKLRNLLNIAYFKDRLERTQSNGYGDLQFNAWFEGQVVEVKISHEHMDYMDTREHPVYEIVRSLNENPKELTLAERTLSDGLKEVSTQTYSVVWEQILFNEVVL